MDDYKELTKYLNNIYTDLNIVIDGDWDISLVCSALEMVDAIAEELDIELSDTREPLNRS